MALPPADDVCDASIVTIDLSPAPQLKAAQRFDGIQLHFSSQPRTKSQGLRSEPAEQHMGMPAIKPLEPLDENEVKAAHSQLRLKVRNHVVPWLFAIVFLVAMCGRNMGVAALSMTPKLGFTDAQYGFGSSIFYAGFIATQLPSVWLARRLGVPLLLSATLMVWSVATGLFALLPYAPRADSDALFTSFNYFCLLRIVLGAAEGALIPAMYFYLTTWYGALPDNLAGMYGSVTIASQVAGVIGGLFAAKLLLLDGMGGLDGWQWIFLFEAVPLCLAACATPFLLARDPEHARWLDLDERKMLEQQRVSTGPDGFRRTAIHSGDSAAAAFDDNHHAQQRRAEQRQRELEKDETLSAYDAARMTALVLTDSSVAFLALCVFLLQITLWSLLYWQPLLIQSRMPSGSSDYEIALFSALPHLCGVLGTLLLGWLANHACCDQAGQRTGANAVSKTERRWHSSTAMVAGGAALTLATITLGTDSLVVPLVLLCTANGCLWAVGGLLTTWPSVWLSQQAAVVALAVLNMASALGGLVGPALVGFLTQVIANENADGSGGAVSAPAAAPGAAADWSSGEGGSGLWELMPPSAPPATVETPAPMPLLSLHAAVGLLGGCAIAAGLLAACFTPKTQVPPPPEASTQGPQTSPAVDVVVKP